MGDKSVRVDDCECHPNGDVDSFLTSNWSGTLHLHCEKQALCLSKVGTIIDLTFIENFSNFKDITKHHTRGPNFLTYLSPPTEIQS